MFYLFFTGLLPSGHQLDHGAHEHCYRYRYWHGACGTAWDVSCVLSLEKYKHLHKVNVKICMYYKLLCFVLGLVCAVV